MLLQASSRLWNTQDRAKSTFLDSVDELLNTADMAYLLTANTLVPFCGWAYVNTITFPYGMGTHRCSRGFYAFGHEMGHIFGLLHNIEESPVNTHFSYGLGYLIQPPGVGEYDGYRTIMA